MSKVSLFVFFLLRVKEFFFLLREKKNYHLEQSVALKMGVNKTRNVEHGMRKYERGREDFFRRVFSFLLMTNGN